MSLVREDSCSITGSNASDPCLYQLVPKLQLSETASLMVGTFSVAEAREALKY